MKTIFTFFTALALGLGLAAGPASAAAETGSSIKQFTVNEFTVYSIQDIDGAIKADLFSGPLSAEQRLTFMPGGEAPSSVNIYLIKGPAGHILVDTGWGRSGPGQGRLAEQLQEIGLSHGEIDLVILTHMHPDHIGGLLDGPDPAFPKAQILVARPELAFWSGQPAVEAPVKPAAEPAIEPEVKSGPEPADEPEAESSLDPAIEPEAESNPEPTDEPEAESSPDPAIEPEAESSPESANEPEVEPATEPTENPQPEPTQVDGTDDWAQKPLAPGASADQDDEEPQPAAAKPAVVQGDLPQAVIDAYGPRLSTFEFDQEISPGLTALSAVGHTPGHTIFLLESGEHRLLFIADLLHAAALQFPEPEECPSYDQDPAQAVAARKAVLQMAVDRNLPVAGAHIPFPGIGQVQADGKHGFTFTPVTSGLE